MSPTCGHHTQCRRAPIAVGLIAVYAGLSSALTVAAAAVITVCVTYFVKAPNSMDWTDASLVPGPQASHGPPDNAGIRQCDPWAMWGRS